MIPRPRYQCPRCQAVSSHPADVAHRYCGRCHLFADDLAWPWRPPPVPLENPWGYPMWLMLTAAIITSNICVDVGHSLWGMIAWIPWAIVITEFTRWERRNR